MIETNHGGGGSAEHRTDDEQGGGMRTIYPMRSFSGKHPQLASIAVPGIRLHLQ